MYGSRAHMGHKQRYVAQTGRKEPGEDGRLPHKDMGTDAVAGKWLVLWCLTENLIVTHSHFSRDT